MSYRIKTVATLTGVTPTTLRAWERRYDVVDPERTEGGYRVYSESDVARLSRIKILVDKGFKVGEAVNLIRRSTGGAAPIALSATELGEIRESLRGALLDFDRRAAGQVYHRVATLPTEEQVERVLLPLLSDIGLLWANGECTIAQEHFCSAFVRERMVGILELLSAGVEEGPEAVCAGLPGERHEFGLLAAAVHLAMRGWQILYLGMDVPVDELGGVLERRRPALLCTSLVLPRSATECLTLAAALRAVAPEGTTIVMGGPGIADELPSALAERVHMVRRVEDLLGLPALAGS